jgi:ankyrin repeat protein
MESFFELLLSQDLPGLETRLREGADPNMRNAVGETLTYRAISEWPQVLPLLLAHGADPNGTNEDGAPPLLWAYNQPDLGSIRLLLSHGADPSCIGDSGTVDFLLAAMGGNNPYLIDRIDKGADPNMRDCQGGTALHIAVISRQSDSVRLLLKRGADVTLRTHTIAMPGDQVHDGSTALLLAVDKGYSEIVQCLLDAGADPNEITNDHSVLSIAAFNGHLDTMRLLMEQGADPTGNISLRAHRCRPLATAAWMGHESAVRLLLQYGAGDTQAALQHAYRATFVDNGYRVCPLLIDAGAKIGLIEAILERDRSLVQRLILAGADVNEPDEVGRTPLMYATGAWSWFGEPDIIRLLLDAGASLHATSDFGETAYSLVTGRRDVPAIAQILREAG